MPFSQEKKTFLMMVMTMVVGGSGVFSTTIVSVFIGFPGMCWGAARDGEELRGSRGGIKNRGRVSKCYRDILREFKRNNKLRSKGS